MISTAFYRRWIRPALFKLEAEQAHHGMIDFLAFAGASAPLRPLLGSETHSKPVSLFGLTFRNPVGLAAGLDKDGVAIPSWEAMGFGFVEVGTVTAHPQPGNAKPRVFRYRDLDAIINRFGFNNQGAAALATRLNLLLKQTHKPVIPIGINLGKSKITPIEEAPGDYLHSFKLLYAFGDYFVLNVSSPNTPGLRSLQGKEELSVLLGTIQAENMSRTTPKPVLLKIAPDLTEQQIGEILELADIHKLAGIIATNTTLNHAAIASNRDQQGGLSGKPLRSRSTEVIKFIAHHSKLPIIGVGGIHDYGSAREKFDAGASLIQLYTGLVYEGPGLVREICSNLS